MRYHFRQFGGVRPQGTRTAEGENLTRIIHGDQRQYNHSSAGRMHISPFGALWTRSLELTAQGRNSASVEPQIKSLAAKRSHFLRPRYRRIDLDVICGLVLTCPRHYIELLTHPLRRQWQIDSCGSWRCRKLKFDTMCYFSDAVSAHFLFTPR